MFYGNIGLNNLSGPVIGKHALTMDEFLQIADIYKKYEKYDLLVFSEEEQKSREESEHKIAETIVPEKYLITSQTLEEYRENIRKFLLVECNEEEAEDLLDLYDEYLGKFFIKYKWSPQTAAFAMMWGY